MNKLTTETKLEWPIDESLIGRKVRFEGFRIGRHNHWGFKVGDVYEIGSDGVDFGPINSNGEAPHENYDDDFNFTLLPEEEPEKTVDKLTTEQLLFAHRIGANRTPANNYDSTLHKYNGSEWFYYDEGWIPSMVTPFTMEATTEKIDFTPLYDWIDHDGGECPVLPGDVVRGIYKNDSVVVTDIASNFEWGHIERFRLKRPENWSEEDDQRQRVIDQNGNTGDHYAEAPETEHSTSHHKRPDGSDLIDDWWKEYPPEIARILMWEQVRKYKNRLGKKDPIHIEVSKMADYMARWAEKEQELTLK